MKRRSIFLSLVLMLVLASTLSFAPAPTVNSAQSQDFRADLIVVPLGDTVNVPHGKSDRWRTINEHYVGWTFGSSVDINRAPYVSIPNVSMSIKTNFEEKDEVGPFSGQFHSTIVITTASDDGAITLNVTGKIDGIKADFGPAGIQILYAKMTGKFNSTGATGSLEGKHLNGTLSYTIDFTNFPAVIINGGTLSGTIH